MIMHLKFKLYYDMATKEIIPREVLEPLDRTCHAVRRQHMKGHTNAISALHVNGGQLYSTGRGDCRKY